MATLNDGDAQEAQAIGFDQEVPSFSLKNQTPATYLQDSIPVFTETHSLLFRMA